MPQAVAVLLVVTQAQAAQQAAVPPQDPAAPQAAQPPIPAAPAQAVPTSQLPVQQSLKIITLAGQGEQNDLERRVMAPLVVQVEDQFDRAIDGALVVFRFPISGPGATFTGGRSSVTVRTNSGGQAAAVNWMANGQVGNFDVHVNATYGNQVGETIVSMSNVTRVVENVKKSKGSSLWSHTWFKAAVIGGAVAIGVGVYFATRGGGSGSGRTITISPGSPTVGGPQ